MLKIGYALTGSFCTLERSISVMSELSRSDLELIPIVSESIQRTDTRFGKSEDIISRIEGICQRSAIKSFKDSEPLGPKEPLDALIIAPCTGNTLSKLAHGITDTAVTMAAKAHLRRDRPLLIAAASNDALSQSLAGLGRLLQRKSVYLVPMLQDDPQNKPHSLVAQIEQIPECLELALCGIQKRPLFL